MVQCVFPDILDLHALELRRLFNEINNSKIFETYKFTQSVKILKMQFLTILQHCVIQKELVASYYVLKLNMLQKVA